MIARVEQQIGLERLSPQQRAQLVDAFQRWLVAQSWPHAAGTKLEVEIDSTKPGPLIIEDILSTACGRKIGSPVAQHLVGAKLARRFPRKTIENYPAAAPDEQPKREADFLVGNTAFHLSVTPASDHLQRCADNLAQGRQAYMIVPAAQVAKARALAEDQKIDGKVAIVAIEGFVGQNIDLMGEFNRPKLKVEIAGLLNEYNRRVADVETDQSIQISIPKHLVED
jgi:hypothetical protein